MEMQPLFPLYYFRTYFYVNKALHFHIKGKILSSDFQQTGLSGQIFVKAPISDFTNICPVGAELLYADRRTAMTKLTAFIGVIRTCIKTEYSPGTRS